MAGSMASRLIPSCDHGVRQSLIRIYEDAIPAGFWGLNYLRGG